MDGMAPQERPKLLVIGLDGVGYDFLNDMLETHELPNFRRLVGEGSFSPLDSVEILLTPVAWSTSYTGRNPGQHNICGFVRKIKNSYLWEYLSPKERASKEYWKILSDQGFRCCLVGPIYCQGERDFDGIYVGGEFSGGLENNIYPEDLKEEVIGRFGHQSSSPCRTLDEAVQFVQKKFLLASHLLGKYPWNLGFVGLMEPDLVHHKSKPQLAQDLYEALDRELGLFLEKIPPETSVVIYSDHGHRMYNKAFHLNSWLVSKGFLKLQPRSKLLKRRLQETRRGVEQLTRSLGGLGEKLFYATLYIGRNLVRSFRLPYRLLRRFLPNAGLPAKAKPVHFVEDINEESRIQLNPGADFSYAESSAYAFMNRGGNYAGICINRKGRDPEGCVSEEEYPQVLEAIMAKLRETVDPGTGRYIVRKVWRRSELFSGEFLEQLPDILFELDPRYFSYLEEDDISSENTVFDFRTSQHDLKGILICSGPIFTKVSHVSLQASLLDIAPTVLHALGAELPNAFEGRILAEVFNQDFLTTHPAKYADIDIRLRPAPEGGFSAEEETILEQRLKNLGYI